MGADKSVELLRTIRGLNNQKEAVGFRILTVKSTAPATFVLEGTPVALDKELFEIPAAFLPLQKGDKFFTFPLVGTPLGQRWAVIQRINR